MPCSKKLGVGPEALFSTLGRVAARGIETQVLAEKMDDWVDALAANMASGELRIHDNSKWEPSTLAGRRDGRRLSRGAAGRARPLGAHHNGLIRNYQCVVPSTWNAGPRDAKGRRGPYEEALLGTPVADPKRPIEILRTVHSFDPCMACGVHVVDATRPRTGVGEGGMSAGRHSGSERRSRVYVWEVPVRIAHWLIAGSIVVLLGHRPLHRPSVPHRARAARASAS